MAYMGRLPSLYIGRLAKGLASAGGAAQASSPCTWLGLGLGSGLRLGLVLAVNLVRVGVWG